MFTVKNHFHWKKLIYTNMKIKRFNESNEFEEIEDTLLDIYDLLGEPRKSEYKVGNKNGYTLSWPLGFQFDEFNGVDKLDKITKVFDTIKGIRSSQSRISGYDIEFKITHLLMVRLTPHSDEISDSYKFYIKQDGRVVLFSYGEIAKFLKDRGYRIKTVNVEEYNSGDNSMFTIKTDAPGEVCVQLATLVKNELEELSEDELDRPIIVTGYNNGIEFMPEEEKCYAELDRYN